MAPAQKPGRSKQDYGTPDNFLDAVKTRLGIEQFDADLAADDTNAVAWPYFTKERSAFSDGWKFGDGWSWLNPPFSNIAPWVERAHQQEILRFARTAVLVPASVGANWWKEYVHSLADVLFLNGRITFKGVPPNLRTGKVDAYPKDCALLLYSPYSTGIYETWTWK